MHFASIGSALALGAILAGSAGIVQAQPAVATFPLPAEPRVLDTAQQRVLVTVVARGLAHPFSLLILPDGDMLVTERTPGRLRAIRKGVLDPTPVAGVPTVHGVFHAGLLDLALHPNFAENRLLYFTYSKPEGGGQFAITLARGSR